VERPLFTWSFLKTRLKNLGRAEVRSFLAEEVVTLERFRLVAVEGQRLPSIDERKRVEQTVLEAYRDGKLVVIHYRDARGRRTSRMIEPLELEVDSYANLWKVKAYCHLRDAERTFLLHRIAKAIPADTEISIISS
jgi:predicted DNA-binding transcriptional regulator YafY